MKKERHIHKIKDHFLSKEFFSLEYDVKTEVLKTKPKPAFEKMSGYYDSKKYLSHQKSGQTLFSKLYFVSKKIMLSVKIKMVTKLFCSTGNALDVGSGTGDFLFALKKRGWSVTGIEPEEFARKEASKLGVQHTQSLKNCDQQEFDLITFWHSLEHVYSLKETIANIVFSLKKGGRLIIACPNYNSLDAKYYKHNWAAWDVPRHLRHFSSKSLENILEPLGFEQTKVSPLILDSFYISILSEKIKKSKMSFFKGVIIGAISNINGLFSKNFSSQIYFFIKKSN
ncbi:MAG: methyltransferase [Flavobacteriaceae bacterium]|nr:methyltransferase [Flavobacteriaceae bacterium]|tara:strand:+ start:510 stop:1358 length:849 start_codon:yes stop_codon:yes gene_type:complete